MKKSFGWAIVGPGAIAHRFAEAVCNTHGTHIEYAQGRNLERAQAFAQHWSRRAKNGIRATESLADVLASPNVDGIYIATPHPFHVDAIRVCLLAKKSVLCEKPMVTDARKAVELAALAREQNTFLMEAVWTRFLPIYDEVGQWLRNNEIGAIRTMQSSFCFNAKYDLNSRLYDPALGGGALLDIGIYNVTVTRWAMQQAFGACPELAAVDARAAISTTRVDRRLAATLTFANEVTSQFVCAFDSSAENAFHIYGERGTITLHPGFWQATRATLTHCNAESIHIDRSFRVNGFEYEIEEAMRCIRGGRIESDRISHRETCETLGWLDRIRTQIGVVYPFD
ncbi:MAG: Gfo/Idh/MocA family protein [Casimicrobium sp.]